MTATIAEKIAAGAAFLDEHEPGWVDRIDVDRLDLASMCGCVLGQLEIVHRGWSDRPRTNPYEWARVRYALPLPRARELGFQSTQPLGPEYERLTAEWRELILARRVGDGAA